LRDSSGDPDPFRAELGETPAARWRGPALVGPASILVAIDAKTEPAMEPFAAGKVPSIGEEDRLCRGKNLSQISD
jgi:hypothetical protein